MNYHTHEMRTLSEFDCYQTSQSQNLTEKPYANPGLLPASIQEFRYENIKTHCVVPEKKTDSVPVSSAYLRNLKSVTLVKAHDKWGNEIFAIFDDKNRLLIEQGFGYLPEHGRILKRYGSSAPQIVSGCHFVRQWPQNHCHWISEDLPSLLIAIDLGFRDQMIIPSRKQTTSFNRHCLEKLEASKNLSMNMIDPVLNIENFTLIRSGHYHPDALALVPNFLHEKSFEPVRRVYVSRERAGYRKISNEREVWKSLQQLGFERVFLEELHPREQIELMRTSSFVVGLHGAGLANIVFASPGISLLEIQDKYWTSINTEIFRNIAAARRIKYGLVLGEPKSQLESWRHRDINVDLDLLEGAVKCMLKKQLGQVDF